MANLGSWNTNMPSGSSLLRDFDDLYRSDKSILTGALNEEHYFESASSASVALHRPGSAAPYFGATSKISTVAKAGYRLFYDESTRFLHALSSTSTLAVLSPSNAYIGIKAGSNSRQTIPGNGSYHPLTLDGEDWDTSNFKASASTDYLITPSDQTGIYDAYIHAAFGTRADNGGGVYGVRLYKNGSATTLFTSISQPDATYGGGSAPQPTIYSAGEVELDSGDSVQLRAAHGNVSAASMGIQHCSITLVRRGLR